MPGENIHQVKLDQIKDTSLTQYIQEQISSIFGNKPYKIIKEQTIYKNTSYSRANRHILVYLIESEGQSTPVFFDVTDVSSFL